MESFFETFIQPFWELVKEMYNSFMDVLPAAIYFILWLLSAIIILPCVFVAGTLYPKWVEWGESL